MGGVWGWAEGRGGLGDRGRSRGRPSRGGGGSEGYPRALNFHPFRKRGGFRGGGGVTLPSDLTHRPSRAEGGSPAGRVRRTFLYHRLSPHHIATPAQHHMSQHIIIRVIVSRLISPHLSLPGCHPLGSALTATPQPGPLPTSQPRRAAVGSACGSTCSKTGVSSVPLLRPNTRIMTSSAKSHSHSRGCCAATGGDISLARGGR